MTDDAERRIASGELWRELTDALRNAERLVRECVPDTPAMRAEGLRYLTRYFAGGTLLCMELADPDWPELQRMVDTTCSWGIDNPDCLYLYSAVRGDASYRIHGSRGSACHLDVQVSRGHFAPMRGRTTGCRARPTRAGCSCASTSPTGSASGRRIS